MKLIEYTDGTLEVVDGPAAEDTLTPRYLHQCLRLKLAHEGRLWPVDDALVAQINARYWPFIEAIAGYLRPPPHLDKMEPITIYHWFIATEPVEVGGIKTLGLSIVEGLMGIEQRAESAGEGKGEGVEGTGDPLLDLIVNVNLVFKRDGARLLKRYSVPKLQKMTAYASRQRTHAMEKMREDSKAGGADEPKARTASATPQEPATTISPEMKERLEALGVDVPA